MSKYQDFGTAMLAYFSRPEGPVEPLQTNWAPLPANDNDPAAAEGNFIERRCNMRPEIGEIRRQLERIETADRRVPGLGLDRARKGPTYRVVTGGDVEFGTYHYGKGVTGKGIIRIGRLRFSDGTKTERAYRRTIDGGVEAFAAVVPPGGMLGTKENQTRILGGDENPVELAASNAHLAEVFAVKPRAHRPAGKIKRGAPMPLAERKAMLAAAYANTDMRRVSVTRCPDGLPAAGGKISDSFLGMKVASTGQGGSTQWQDIMVAKEGRDAWARMVAELPKDTVEVLDAAMTAQNLAELGGAGSRRAAERRGKARLQAANDNLAAAMQKIAA